MISSTQHIPSSLPNGLLWLRNLELIIVIIGCLIVVPALVMFCSDMTSDDILGLLTLTTIAAMLLMEVEQIFVLRLG